MLKYSGKSVRRVSWNTGHQILARPYEQAWRAFDGNIRYMVPVTSSWSRHCSTASCTTATS